MKVAYKNPTFVPVELTITFETQNQLDAFASLMNSHPVTSALLGVSGVDIADWGKLGRAYTVMQKMGADTSRWTGPLAEELKLKLEYLYRKQERHYNNCMQEEHQSIVHTGESAANWYNKIHSLDLKPVETIRERKSTELIYDVEGKKIGLVYTPDCDGFCDIAIEYL